MRCEHTLTALVCVMAASLFAVQGRAQTEVAGDSAYELRSVSNRPTYPVVLRLSPAALDSFVPGKVDHRQAVDSVVLGTRNVGHSHTTGKVTVDLISSDDNISDENISDDNDAVFEVVFQGLTHTRTTGTNGPALIDSHADTQFHCSRRIRFDPQVGFVSEPSVFKAKTTLVYDRFRASSDGVGSRIVRRVAERRAADSHDEARRIAAQNQETEILKAFNYGLDDKLASVNAQLSLARYGGFLLGESSRMHLALASSNDSLQIGFGPPGSTGPLPGLPSLASDGPQMEIWIHSSVLEKRPRTVIPLRGLKAERLLSRRNVWPIWNAVVAVRQSANLDPAPRLGWFRIGFSSSGKPQSARNESRVDAVTAMKLIELGGAGLFAVTFEGAPLHRAR